MIETIDARTTLRHPPRSIASWDYHRSGDGRASWRATSLPPGLSMCAYVRTPEGDHRLRVEGNLTTALHGDGSAAYSLRDDELGPAVRAFLDLAGNVVGQDLPKPAGWDVHRLDPSITLRLGDELHAAALISDTVRAWDRLALPRQRVSWHRSGDGLTAVWSLAKWRSWSVYDKTAERRSRGDVVLPGLLRMEARVRPRRGSGEWKAAAPTLVLDNETRRLVVDELKALGETVVGKAAAMAGATLVRTMVDAGVSPSTAARLTGFLIVGEELGPRFWSDLGLPDRTLKRWRAEVRQALGSVDESALREMYGSVAREWLDLDGLGLGTAIYASEVLGGGTSRSDSEGSGEGTEGGAHGAPAPSTARRPAPRPSRGASGGRGQARG